VTWLPVGPALLFCPADRPDRYDKAMAGADMVILDLEDGVNPSDRAAARECLKDHVLDPLRTIVRVNPVGTPDHSDDLRALGGLPYRMVLLAKTESAAQVASLAAFQVMALCETATGVQDAPAIARSPATVALMWGAEDLVASLGGRSSRDPRGGYREFALYARSRVLIAAKAAGRVAVDAVHLDIDDHDGLRREAEDAVASGFDATACIHPSQVEVVRGAHRPSEDDVAWARAVVDAATTERGVFVYEGRMVDAPLLRQAERILRFAGR
jgi:citrate lyase subunit beta / citryl-CoA lyase